MLESGNLQPSVKVQEGSRLGDARRPEHVVEIHQVDAEGLSKAVTGALSMALPRNLVALESEDGIIMIRQE